MKKLIVFILFLFLLNSYQSFAQNKNFRSIIIKPKLTTQKFKQDVFEAKSKFGFEIGYHHLFKLKENIKLRTGLTYNLLRFDISEIDSSFIFNGQIDPNGNITINNIFNNITSHNFEIPINLLVYFANKKQMYFSIGINSIFQFANNSESTIKNDESYFILELQSIFIEPVQYFNLLELGIGNEFNLNKFAIFVEPNFSFALNNTLESAEFAFTKIEKVSHFEFGISTGIRF